MKYFSMFSGIGGFELGIKRTNPEWKCVGYSEIDKYTTHIYQKHFKHKNYGDTKHINWGTVPDFDLLCAGFPCQSFSVAGRRKGFDDTRGTLFFEICRAIKDKKPKLLLLENVKGLLNHDKGNTFRTILRSLDELGYDAEWEVLNSKHYGVPQNRERVFIIGHLREESSRQVFPIGKSNILLEEKNNRKQEEKERICSTIDSRYGSLRNSGETYIFQQKYGENPIFPISPTLTKTETRDTLVIHNFHPRTGNPNEGGTGHLSKSDGTSYCLDTGNQGVEIKNKIRRLTPTECERLQGFPDGWTKGISDSQRYKCLGNAVTVNVIENIIRRIA